MTVPRKALASIRVLAELSDDQMAALVATLATPMEGIASPGTLANNVAELGEPYTRQATLDLTSTLFNLSALHFTQGWDLAEIVAVVADSPDLEVDAADRPKVRDRLSVLLAEPVVAALAKASSIAYEHQNSFDSARVVSDIRPIFGDDPTVEPSGAMITHTLHIDYVGSEGHSSLYVTLSGTELEELASSVRRAQEKDETLRRLVVKAGMHEFNAVFE